jgi:hypothetical protein
MDKQPTASWLAEFAVRNKRLFFIAALFVIVFTVVRLFVPPVNNFDYTVIVNAVDAARQGRSPYDIFAFLTPPWSMFVYYPLAAQSLSTWLALNAAIFVAAAFDIGKPSALILLAHPIFITLMVSSNPEWLLIGSGLWLLYRAPKGWLRGVAWLLLSCKMHTLFFLLIDGYRAFRARDWRAFLVSSVVILISLAMFPDIYKIIGRWPGWSLTVIYHLGLGGALTMTLLILLLRWRRWGNGKTIGLMLGPIWAPYMVQYGLLAVVFTMRHAGWLANLVFVALSIGLTALFWQQVGNVDHIAIMGMLALAALLAPLPPDEKRTSERSTPVPDLPANVASVHSVDC